MSTFHLSTLYSQLSVQQHYTQCYWYCTFKAVREDKTEMISHIVCTERNHKHQLRGGHALLTSLLLIWPWLWILWGRTLSSDLNLWCNCFIRFHTRRVGRPLAWSECFWRKAPSLPSVVHTVRLLPCAELTCSQQIPWYKACQVQAPNS
jgi:hypothetical protein